MSASLLYLGLLLAVICVWFSLLRRPIYEAVLAGFLVLLSVTGNWHNLRLYAQSALSTSLLYSMTAFAAMSAILTKTKLVDDCITILLSLLGRIPGGAGYAAVISSSFMGALSGSGPGNVMATGAITIPAMKRSGFPPELAANVESNASYLGNMIPPSANIVAALGAFTALYPDEGLTSGRFWIILWSISLWFIAQRMVTVWGFCKYYHIRAIPREELPDLKQALRSGWKGLLLPLVLLVPFLLDNCFRDTLFTARLGATGAKQMSGSILLFIGGLATILACILANDKSLVTPANLAKILNSSIKSIAPPVAVCLFGYMVGALYADLNVSGALENLIAAWQFGKIGTVVTVCAIACAMGMVIPGSSLVVIFGPVFISSLSLAGVNPVLAAAMLPCICGVMCGITPPLGLGMYAGMALAQSDFQKTFRNNLVWVACQFGMQVVVLMGWLPVWGM